MVLIRPLEALALSDLSLEAEGDSVNCIKIGMGPLDSEPEQKIFHIGPCQGILNISYQPEPENKNRVSEIRQFAGKGFTLVKLASGEAYAIYNKPESFPKIKYHEGVIDSYRIRRREILRLKKS